MPGIDGLRALAVAGVVMFHLPTVGLVGGYLGVDLFLVISGYLITALLVAEADGTGRIRLGAGAFRVSFKVGKHVREIEVGLRWIQLVVDGGDKGEVVRRVDSPAQVG